MTHDISLALKTQEFWVIGMCCLHLPCAALQGAAKATRFLLNIDCIIDKRDWAVFQSRAHNIYTEYTNTKNDDSTAKKIVTNYQSNISLKISILKI